MMNSRGPTCLNGEPYRILAWHNHCSHRCLSFENYPIPRVDNPFVMTIIIVMTRRREPFKLIYAPLVKNHLRVIESKYYSLIRKTIENQLRFEPDVETRNRKPLKRPIDFEAEWEIRFGPNNRLRVFYEVNRESYQVNILAIGEKKGSQLFIGGKEFDL